MATDLATQPVPSAPATTTGLLAGRSRTVLIALGVLVLFAITYGLAWLDASRRNDPTVTVQRRFSLERARRNREYRAVTGLLLAFVLLILKARLTGSL